MTHDLVMVEETLTFEECNLYMNRSWTVSPLVEFSYVSSPVSGLPAAAMLRLAGQSWSHNQRAGITGRLHFDAGQFRQVLEGPSEVVLPLSSRILADARHGDIEIVAFGPIAARRYDDWSVSGFEGLAANAAGGIDSGPAVTATSAGADRGHDACGNVDRRRVASIA